MVWLVGDLLLSPPYISLAVTCPRVQTDYVFAAHLSISDAAALSKKEATNPRAVHDVISTEWLIEVDQAGELLAIM